MTPHTTHRIRNLTLALAALIVLGAFGASANAGRIDLPDGTTIIGPIKRPGEYIYPNNPLVIVNVPCPTGSVQISETKTAKTVFSTTGKVTVGGGFGPINAAIDASFGYQVGETHTISITANIPADKYKSKKVTIFTRYVGYDFTVSPPGTNLGFTRMTIWVPVGWFQKHENVAPNCPCPQVQNTRDNLDQYKQSLQPGGLRDTIERAENKISNALGRFDESSADDLHGLLVSDLTSASGDLVASLGLDADPFVVGFALDTLAGTVDEIVQMTIESATQNIFDNMLELPPLCPDPAIQLHFEAQQIFFTGDHLLFYEGFLLMQQALIESEALLEQARNVVSPILFTDGSDDPNDPGIGAPDLSECALGTVGLGARVNPEQVLFVNGSAGGSDFTMQLDLIDPMHAVLQMPEGGGPGRFVIHANLGLPQQDFLFELPGDIGTTCFPLLLPPAGTADPFAVWNNLGKENLVGSSIFLGQPIPDPLGAPSTFLNLPLMPPEMAGLTLTLQGVVLDPNSQSPKGASVTNAVIVEIGN